MKTRLTALMAVILFLVTALSGNAAEFDVSALPTPVGTLLDVEGGVLEIDLLDAYQLALARNLNLHVSRYDLAIADANIRGSGGIFDPYFTASVNGDSTESPTSTILEGANVAQSRNTRFFLGVEQLLPSGTQIGGTWNSLRGETNSTFFFRTSSRMK